MNSDKILINALTARCKALREENEMLATMQMVSKFIGEDINEYDWIKQVLGDTPEDYGITRPLEDDEDGETEDDL